jgi:hypothetical protein
MNSFLFGKRNEPQGIPIIAFGKLKHVMIIKTMCLSKTLQDYRLLCVHQCNAINFPFSLVFWLPSSSCFRLNREEITMIIVRIRRFLFLIIFYSLCWWHRHPVTDHHQHRALLTHIKLKSHLKDTTTDKTQENRNNKTLNIFTSLSRISWRISSFSVNSFDSSSVKSDGNST